MNDLTPTEVTVITLEQTSSETFRQAQLYLEKIATELEALHTAMQAENNAQEALLQSGDEQTRMYLLRPWTDAEDDEEAERARTIVNLGNILSILKTGTPSICPRSSCQHRMLVATRPGGPYVALPE